jgi:hypothetical protein
MVAILGIPVLKPMESLFKGYSDGMEPCSTAISEAAYSFTILLSISCALMTTRLSKRRVSRLRFVFIIKVNYLDLSTFKNTILEQ